MKKQMKQYYLVFFATVLLWPFTSTAQSLPLVSGANYDGDQISWSPIAGAIGYNVYHANEGAMVYLDTVTGVTSYKPVIEGSHSIVGFDAVGNFSPLSIYDFVDYSNSVFVSFSDSPIGQIGMVTGVAFDGSNITWDALKGAIGYNVHYFYKGRGWSYLDTVGNVNRYTPSLAGSYIIVGYDEAGNFSPFQINGGGSDTNNVEVSFIDKTSGQLGSVTGIALEDGTITWDALEGAIGYNIYKSIAGLWSYLETIGNATTYTLPGSGTYRIVGYDGKGNFSPL